MILNKEKWVKEDELVFIQYLEQYRRQDKEDWSRKILNTKLDVLAIPTPIIREIANQIFKGNYKSFLDLRIFNSYESIAIYGSVISKIKDFKELTYYLDVYLDFIENWAHVDLLSPQINDKNKNDFLMLSNKLLYDSRVFVRRLSLLILFKMVNDESILPIIFNSLLVLKGEKEYYVIMMAGWLLSECIIKYKDQTLEFISNTNELNKMIINKGIQKCRDSRRLSQDEKDDLLKYKRK